MNAEITIQTFIVITIGPTYFSFASEKTPVKNKNVL
jgi:hypothetical protein